MSPDWVLLTYQIGEDVERMFIPPEKNPPSKSNWSWLFYAGYTMYKIYTFSRATLR